MTEIRPFEPADLDFALEQKAREGWVVSREQFEVYLEHDPDGCFVATADGRPVGMVTTTCFGRSGWIGNLIVEPRWRSRGFGRALMARGLDRLREYGTTTIRLEADPPGVPLYRKLGFVNELESLRLALPASRQSQCQGEARVEVLRAADLEEVAALDATVVGADRRRFLELKRPRAELALVRRRGAKVVAYLLASSTDRGLRIGPSVALSGDDARVLITAATSAAADRPVLIGLPAPNLPGLAMLAEMGFERGASCARMRLGPAGAGGDPTRVFAISSGAVG